MQLNRHRFYAAALGRWVNRDPFRYIGGYNLYLYVDGIPLIFVDPWGLEGVTPIDAVIGIGEDLNCMLFGNCGPGDGIPLTEAVPGIINDLGEIPGSINDHANQAVDDAIDNIDPNDPIGSADDVVIGVCIARAGQLIANGSDCCRGGGNGPSNNSGARGRGRGRGKGERGKAGKPSGTPNPWKHYKPHPTDPKKVIFKDPHTGKEIVKPKPPGFPAPKQPPTPKPSKAPPYYDWWWRT